MKFKRLPIFALLALPAMAQDAWQVGLGLNFQDRTNLSTSGTRLRQGTRFVPSLLTGYRLVDFGTNDLTVTMEYQFRSNYDFGTVQSGGKRGNFGYRKEFFAPGMQWNFHQTPQLDWGLGLHMRFVNLKANSGERITNNAPWMDAHVRYTFQDLGGVKPFVGFRVARALTSHPGAPDPKDTLGGQIRTTMRRMDGVWDASLQAGIRF